MPKRQLPPLILHPFSDDPAGPEKLMEASRAGLILQGLLPPGDFAAHSLEARLLDGRYCELRMLFYLGKDLLRWVSQCMELVERIAAPERGEIQPESFAALLVENPPSAVAAKLLAWGVQDFKSIFSRALGLHAVFDSMPGREQLTPGFVRHYHRFADALYACRQRLFPFDRLNAAEWDFELYASAEYSRLLEDEWGAL